MRWEARDYSEWQGAFKQEPSILSAAIEEAMKGAVPLAFAIQQSAECPLRVDSVEKVPGGKDVALFERLRGRVQLITNPL
jgi:hypothetical protein